MYMCRNSYILQYCSRNSYMVFISLGRLAARRLPYGHGAQVRLWVWVQLGAGSLVKVEHGWRSE